jgi:molybdate transport system permease protein
MAVTAQELGIIGLTLKVAAFSVLLSLPLALMAAWLLARVPFYGKSIIDGLIHLPLVLPPVVIGYFLLLGFSPTGWGGAVLQNLFGVSVAFRWTGAALASAIMGFPLMVRAIRLSCEAVDPRLEQAARTLGASRAHVFFSVTLPLIWPGIVAGMILGFARSLGEFGATITFVSNIPGETETLPIAIYALLQRPDADGQVLRLSLIAIVLSWLALMAADRLSKRWRA